MSSVVSSVVSIAFSTTHSSLRPKLRLLTCRPACTLAHRRTSGPTVMPKSRREAEAEVRSWGYSHVFTWTDGPILCKTGAKVMRADSSSNAHYPPHKHSGKTTHLILDGSLTMRYPDDADPKKETLGVGKRWDVDAGKSHEVWVGSSGCTYVIGE